MTDYENVDFRQVLADLKEKTATDSIVLKPYVGSPDDTDSKFGGAPYMPKDFDYPTTADGQNLKLLAQLNFEQLPPLKNFPTKGILQFFVLSSEDLIGVDFDNPTKQDKFRVIYYSEILPKSERRQDLSAMTMADDEYAPVQAELALDGQIETSFVRSEDYRFEQMSDVDIGEAFSQLIKRRNEAGPGEEFERLDDKVAELDEILEEYETETEIGKGHRIGGWPGFTQSDPRGYAKDDLKRFDTLLFQMDSDWAEDESFDIMWGDMGVANFFINAEDLRNLNFENVLYNWDCG